MKKLKCSGLGCETKRAHHEEPDTPRGPQYIDVPDPVTRAFCSLECKMYFEGANKRLES